MTTRPPAGPARGGPVPPDTADPPRRSAAARLLAAATRLRAWWRRQRGRTRTGIVVGAVLVLGYCANQIAPAATPQDRADNAGLSTTVTTPGTPASPEPTTVVDRTPRTEVQTVTESEEVPFEERTVDDPDLPVGTTEVRSEGRPGEKTLRYRVTYTDGVETGRVLLSEEVTREPVDHVVARGTKQETRPEPAPEPEPAPGSGCHPSYAGACVPIASDVDCAGGSGNGPEYVSGPIRVVGPDEYRLDHDNDGTACE